MSYEDSNTGGRYGRSDNDNDDSYGDSTRTNIRDRDTDTYAQESKGESGYGKSTSYDDDDSSNTRYGESTHTNIKDNSYSSNTDPDTSLQPPTSKSRRSDYDNDDGNITGDYEASSLTDNNTYGGNNRTARLNEEVSNQPQQSRTTGYDRERETRDLYGDNEGGSGRTGGGLGAEDNITSKSSTTGGAGQDRDQYGMGPGRTKEQEIGGYGGRPERFDEDTTTGYGGGEEETRDSTKGKLMEKAGSLLGSKSLERKGEEARRDAGRGYGGDDSTNEGGYGGSGGRQQAYSGSDDTGSKGYGGRDGAGEGGNARYDGV